MLDMLWNHLWQSTIFAAAVALLTYVFRRHGAHVRYGLWLAASLRFRNVIDTYQTTTHAPEALMRLTESYLALGMPGEAQRSAAVLGANYPGSRWYERAYQLVSEHPPQAAVAPVEPGSEVLPAPETTPEPSGAN